MDTLESVQQPNFQVFISGMPRSSLEDWRRALRAPSSEWPPLNEGDKAFAHKFGIPEEDYRRSRLLHSYGEERLKKRGTTLGCAVESILSGLGRNDQLVAVIYEAEKPRWVIGVQEPQRVVNVAIPAELADRVVDSNTVQDQQELQTLLLSNLGRSELLNNRERR